MTTEQRVEAWKRELDDIHRGWPWAFAKGGSCAGANNHPSLRRVLERELELEALIAEHS